MAACGHFVFLLRAAVPAVVPRAGRLCHGTEDQCWKWDKRGRNTEKMQQGVNSCKRELVKFSRGVGDSGGLHRRRGFSSPSLYRDVNMHCLYILGLYICI